VGRILVTGGAGYIGSHVSLELLAGGHEVAVLDNLANSSVEAVARVARIAERPLAFYEIDIRDRAAVQDLFEAEPLDAVVHCAGLKAVGESVAEPLAYYDTNVAGAVVLLGVMVDHGVRRIVFSSSCTVQGEPEVVPVTEDQPRRPVSPYGRTKAIVEEMIEDLVAADPTWRALLLRYFNPVGAHPSGRIGEDPVGVPNNLMPYVMQVAGGLRSHVRVFGDDYPTSDGTGVRDYVHVVDLALGHVAAIDALERLEGCRAVNLGTGRGSSVLEVLAAASRAVGRELPYRIEARRPGDTATVYADPTLAAELLGWRASRDLDAMCADHWAWQRANPRGYEPAFSS
jgi:UDP-glucose 4-epimerase